MKKIVNGIAYVYLYCISHIYILFFYDRKYIHGNCFSGKYGGIFADGWRWIVTDCRSRILFGTNKNVPFPVNPNMKLICPENILFNINDLKIFQNAGNYYQAYDGKIIIGKGTWIAKNVGLITANHELENPDQHQKGKDIIIGEKCWIGMNSVILPGVILGNNTVVGAGSVVTKSFNEGNCVIAGNPARIIKTINSREEK